MTIVVTMRAGAAPANDNAGETKAIEPAVNALIALLARHVAETGGAANDNTAPEGAEGTTRTEGTA